jgi:transposase
MSRERSARMRARASSVAQSASAAYSSPMSRIYLAVDPVDLRRGHDGLSAIVQGQWGVDLFEGHLFVFFGRRRDRCKILFWARGGLVLYYKRLEQGRFRMPKIAADGRSVQIDATELAMMLDASTSARCVVPRTGSLCPRKLRREAGRGSTFLAECDQRWSLAPPGDDDHDCGWKAYAAAQEQKCKSAPS